MLRSTFPILLLASAVLAMAQAPKSGFNVERKAAGTPEISSTVPAQIENGKQTDVVLKGKNFAAGTPSSSGPCKVLKSSLVSATEARFTIVSTSEDGGECNFSLGRVGGTVKVLPTPAAAARMEKEKEAQHAKDMAAAQKTLDFLKNAPATMGKKWTVTLPTGKADTWTRKEAADSDSNPEFKNAAGEAVQIMLAPPDAVVVQVGACVFTGKLVDTRVTGEAPLPASMCKYGTGKWSATIEKK
jgi:hypothetical protein